MRVTETIPIIILALSCFGQALDAPPPQPRSVTAVFEGHFERAFEMSRFVPCRGQVSQPDGSVLEVLSAWAQFQPAMADRIRALVPNAAEITPAHVRFHGTLRGPGLYGHMGQAYELVVDRVDYFDTHSNPKCEYISPQSELARRLKK